MAKVQIETTQNVLLDFELGDVGDRIGAALIDELIKFGYTIIMYLIIISFVSGDFLSSTTTSIIVFKFILSLPLFLYYPVFEYLWNGQTPGKKRLKLRVIRFDGSKPSVGDFIIRFLFRTIDTQGGFLIAIMLVDTLDLNQVYMLLIFLFLLPFPIIGILSIAFTKNKQRLGDLLAGTLVVKITQRVSLEDTMLLSVKDDYTPKLENVLRLSDRDIRMIKEALDLYKKTNDPKHIRILASKTREILEVKQKIKALPLLKTVIKDYNILAIEKDS